MLVRDRQGCSLLTRPWSPIFFYECGKTVEFQQYLLGMSHSENSLKSLLQQSRTSRIYCLSFLKRALSFLLCEIISSIGKWNANDHNLPYSYCLTTREALWKVLNMTAYSSDFYTQKQVLISCHNRSKNQDHCVLSEIKAKQETGSQPCTGGLPLQVASMFPKCSGAHTPVSHLFSLLLHGTLLLQ